MMTTLLHKFTESGRQDFVYTFTCSLKTSHSKLDSSRRIAIYSMPGLHVTVLTVLILLALDLLYHFNAKGERIAS